MFDLDFPIPGIQLSNILKKNRRRIIIIPGILIYVLHFTVYKHIFLHRRKRR